MVNEHEEDRLRQLLRDDAWSLPAWPDAGVRVRRTARRQRMATASASVAACALVAAAVVLPLRLAGGPAPGDPAAAGSRPAASQPATPTPSTPPQSYTLPPVNAPGYPADIYPPPQLRLLSGTLSYCPSGSNVRPFSQASSEQATGVLTALGHSLDGDLRLTDRAFWPALIKEWLGGGGTGLSLSTTSGQMLYTGPLVNYQSLNGPPGLYGLIAVGCGSWLAQSTWLIVAGPDGSSPAALNELLFINRGGHVLLYYSQ
ncbi:MAG TPA: hypothetical protein VGI74_13840 [Streptosporangiaceae bacterium]|jgi:hypothetical protein